MYRGSLSQCINSLGVKWTRSQDKFLAILCHPAAKYYSVADDNELSRPEYQPETGDVRLVFRGTKRELRAFLEHPQTDMLKELIDGAPPDNHETRE